MLAVAVVTPHAVDAQTPATDPDLQSALDQLKTNAEAIAKVKLPMATEPACHFKA